MMTIKKVQNMTSKITLHASSVFEEEKYTKNIIILNNAVTINNTRDWPVWAAESEWTHVN